MKLLGIIPARYNSIRYPGKPLAKINGRPMLYWVYLEAKQSRYLDEVIIATEDLLVVEVCKQLNIPVMLTSNQHTTPLSRLYEVASKIGADYYIFIGVDEPLLTTSMMDTFIEQTLLNKECFISHAMTAIQTKEDFIDNTNIKLEVDSKGLLINTYRNTNCHEWDFGYMKFVGLGIFTLESLNFFFHTKPSEHEELEKCDLLRFVENEIPVKMIDIHSDTISVDTIADRQRVEKLFIEKRGKV